MALMFITTAVTITHSFIYSGTSMKRTSIKRTIFLSPAEIIVKCMEQNLDLTEPSFISKTNTIQNPNHKIYLAITKNCQHVIKDESQTDQQG